MWRIRIVVYHTKETNQLSDQGFCCFVVEKLISIILFLMDFNVLLTTLNVIPNIFKCSISVCFGIMVLTIILEISKCDICILKKFDFVD
jgi:hypothetical protein